MVSTRGPLPSVNTVALPISASALAAAAFCARAVLPTSAYSVGARTSGKI
jgi:hypothetical protein